MGTLQLVFVGAKHASELCLSTGITSRQHSQAGRLLQGEAAICLCKSQACKRIVPVDGHHLPPAFAGQAGSDSRLSQVFMAKALTTAPDLRWRSTLCASFPIRVASCQLDWAGLID